jgi:hypothetical protein
MPKNGTEESVKYGDFKFIGQSGFPSPLINVSKDFQRDGAGRQIGATINISLEGKIFATISNSNTNINAWSKERFDWLQSQETLLRQTFGKHGDTLTIGNCSHKENFHNIKVVKYNANRTDDLWVSTIDYSIDLVSEVYASGSGFANFYVTSTQEDWSIEPVDEFVYTKFSELSSLGFRTPSNPSNNNFEKYPMYRISRTVGAVGKYVPATGGATVRIKTPLENARDWVDYHLKDNSFKATGIINNLKLYNFIRNINKSETDGVYKIVDTWLAGENTQAYTESFTIETSLDSTTLRTVEIKGTVKGLEPYNTGITDGNYLDSVGTGIVLKPLVTSDFRLVDINNNNKFINAISGYSGIKTVIYDRADSFLTANLKYPDNNNFSILHLRKEHFPLNPIPVSITEGFNPSDGSISYSYSYNNRPANAVPGSISESLSVTENNSVPLVSSIFVLGRKLGPILQDLGTVSSSTRRVSFEVILPTTGLKNIAFPLTEYNSMNSIIEQFKPTADVVILKEESSDWNISENRLVRDKTWEYSRCRTI